ncbi:MAG: tRNA (adenosine(37)-N6)-threonylcarbamoyltransferase complex transferase subunit TsaD [Oligoflexales bacterium]
MLVVGIESSCDETAVALVKDGKEVVSSLVSSQIDIHKRFGGVVPEVAARAHLEALPSLWDEAMAGYKVSDLDGIAVTQGPGLIGALLVGVSFAKGLHQSSGVPLIPVNHVHAHLHGAFLGLEKEVQFPCLALVVSGGHTNLYRMDHPLDFQLLAVSIDDACGESFDKVARLLKLGYPGGPVIEKQARLGHGQKIPMPKMMHGSGRFEFSYSGLKTHMMRLVHHSKESWEVPDLCDAFQEEALGQIVRMVENVLKQHSDLKTFVIAGGVAANRRFRDMLEPLNVDVVAPKLEYCSDNAAMIAALGSEELKQSTKLDSSSDLEPFARYPYENYWQ